MAESHSPSFDLVVATVGRVAELDRLLASLERQTHRAFRILLVDQNDDDRVAAVLGRHEALAVTRLTSGRGLSRARNAALDHVDADVVAFPDDDCAYANDLLERVAAALRPELDGLTGRDEAAAWPRDRVRLRRENVWNRAISYTIFLRRAVVERVGRFDERLGLPSGSGEEIDYLIRAIDAGAQIEYDPSLVVDHEGTERDLRALGSRDGVSVGYLLRKHRYPARTVARMLVRPTGGALLAAARLDAERARFHLATLRGRVAGYASSR